jgi:hypothetical protein
MQTQQKASSFKDSSLFLPLPGPDISNVSEVPVINTVALAFVSTQIFIGFESVQLLAPCTSTCATSPDGLPGRGSLNA